MAGKQASTQTCNQYNTARVHVCLSFPFLPRISIPSVIDFHVDLDFGSSLDRNYEAAQAAIVPTSRTSAAEEAMHKDNMGDDRTASSHGGIHFGVSDNTCCQPRR